MAQEVYFSDIKNTIIKNLKSCNYDLKIAVAWFTDEKIISVVNDLLLEGIRVTIIIYDDYINRKDLYEKLYHNKALILLSKKLMHNKFCVIDYKTIINGSYNWTNNARTNDENIQITYNDEAFANNFVNEFNKISSNCTSIEGYFKYSFSNLKSIENEFEIFYAKWTNYKFPYFFKINDSKLNKTIEKTSFGDCVYLIKNNSEEKKFLWYYYLIKINYNVSKILKITQEKLELPLKFNDILFVSYDNNNVFELKHNKYLVEEILKKQSNLHKYLFFINNKGENISEGLEYTGLLQDNKFYFFEKFYDKGFIENLYFIETNLTKTKINYGIERIIISNNKAFLFVISIKDEKGKKRYGLLNTKNEIVLKLEFDAYFLENSSNDDYRKTSKFNSIENKSIDFYEFAILKKHDNKVDINSDYNQFVKKRYKFCLNSNTILSVSKIDSYGNFSDDFSYLFLSDDNYKYKDFYFNTRKFILKLSTMNFSNLTYDDKYLKVNEFEELMKYSNELYDFHKTCNYFIYLREKRDRVLGLENERKKEGRCYIATMVYGDYNHPDVLLLRNFRDSFLNKILFGVLFIKVYYKYSPRFVKLAEKNKLLSFISKIFIFNLVSLMKKCY